MPDKAPADAPPLNSILAQSAPAALAQAQQSKAEERKILREDIMPQFREQSSRELPPPPRQPPPALSPQPQYTDPMQSWGSLAMGIAMLGSAFTRQPLTNALNAGAAVNNAYRRGDLEASRQNLDVWKAQTDYAHKVFEYQQATYRDALAKLKDDRAGTLAELRALATAYKDDGLLEMLRFGQIELIEPHFRVLDAQYKNEQVRTQEASADLSLKVQKLEITNAIKAAAAAGNQPEVDRQTQLLRDIEGKSPGGAAGEKLEVSKPFDIIDDKGKVVRQVMARERRDKAGFIDSETGEPINLEPGQHLKQITPTTSGGGRAGAQVLRQQIGGREVLSDLQNAVALPVGTTIGVLGTAQAGPSVLGALQGDLVRTLTDQDSQLMQASMASMTRELSILMSPVYGGNWAAQQIDPLVPKTGDTLGTVLFKLARLAQSADNALEAVSKSPILSNDQQSYSVDLQKQIQEAIPWTPKQAMDFAHKEKKPKQTFGEFVKKNINTPETVPEGVPPGSKKVGTKDGNDVYEAPDGERYMVH